jgi:hypothetical protein
MSDNIRDTLSNLDVNLDMAGPGPGQIPGEKWWCFWGCLGTGCHGLTNSAQYCPMGDCSSTQCNNNATNWHTPGNCLGMACDIHNLNSVIG